jgi:hypothetical protein
MSPPRKKAAAKTTLKPSGLRLERSDDGTWRVFHPVKQYRVLFASGVLVDVLSTHLDSDVTGALLEAAGEERIEGVAVVEEAGS